MNKDLSYLVALGIAVVLAIYVPQILIGIVVGALGWKHKDELKLQFEKLISKIK